MTYKKCEINAWLEYKYSISQAFGKVKILFTVYYYLSFNVIYPIFRVENIEAYDANNIASDYYLTYVTSDDAKKIFDSYYFDTNVE